MDLDGVFEAAGVAAGQRDGDRNFLRARFLEHQSVAPLQPFDREFQPAQLIIAIGVGARHVIDQVGLKFVQRLIEAFLQFAAGIPHRRRRRAY